MKRFLALLLIAGLLAGSSFASNRVTTWSTSQVLTSTALNGEFDNIVNNGTIDRTGGRWGALDDVPLTLGSGQDVQIEWDSAQTQDLAMIGIASGEGFGLMILDKADMATNFGLSARTNPSLFIHSADATSANEYLEFQHDGTNGVINVGDGTLVLHLAGSVEADLATDGFNLITGDSYQINNTSVLNATTLGSGVTASSLTSVGTLTSLTVSGSAAFATSSGTVGVGSSANTQIMFGVGGTLNAQANLAANGAQVSTTIVEASSGTHGLLIGLKISPSFTNNAGATTTHASGLYIDGVDAPTGTTTATNLYIADAPTGGGTNNYSMWVDAGEVRIDGPIGDSTNRVENGWFTNVDTSVLSSATSIQLAPAAGSGVSVTLSGTGDFSVASTLLVVDTSASTAGAGIASPTAQFHVSSGAADRVALAVNAAASTSVVTTQWTYNTTDAAYLQVAAAASDFTLQSRDFGNNIAGPQIRILRNVSAGTEGPAAGTLRYLTAGNTVYALWVDDTGEYRIHTAAPTGSSGSPTVSDLAGTVVGDQTSWHAIKSNIQEVGAAERKSALASVLAAKMYSYKLQKDDKTRIGYVIYPKDRGSWFSQNDKARDSIPALDQRNLFGYYALAIQELERRIAVLEAK